MTEVAERIENDPPVSMGFVLKRSLKTQHVSFELLVEALYRSTPGLTAGRVTTNLATKDLDTLLELFAAEHGEISEMYRCNHVLAACAVTTKNRLFVVYPGGSKHSARLSTAVSIADDAAVYLAGAERQRCIHHLQRAARCLLRLLDQQLGSRASDGVLDEEGEQFVDQEIALAANVLRKAQIRDSRWLYLLGAAAGVAVLTFAAHAFSKHIAEYYVPFFAALWAGAGASLSVLQRLLGLELDTSAGRKLIFLNGMVRPLGGALLGTAVWLLATGGWLPLRVEGTADVQKYFYWGGAFLVGFSERLAGEWLKAAGAT